MDEWLVRHSAGERAPEQRNSRPNLAAKDGEYRAPVKRAAEQERPSRCREQRLDARGLSTTTSRALPKYGTYRTNSVVGEALGALPLVARNTAYTR